MDRRYRRLFRQSFAKFVKLQTAFADDDLVALFEHFFERRLPVDKNPINTSRNHTVDEIAVEQFLSGHLNFNDIPRACRAVLDSHNFDPNPSLPELIRLDGWARQETLSWTSSRSI